MLAYGMSSAQQKSVAAREVAGRFQALNDVLAQRPTAGVTPQLEARIIDANTLRFRREEREAALATTTALAELNQLCGRPGNAPLKVTAGNVQFSTVSLPRLLTAARANAFDIRIRQVEFAQQGIKVALSKNERFPAIAIGPFYSMENAIDREQRAGVGVSIPLPLWDRNLGNIATSKARQQQAEASLAMTEREVERRVTQNAAILTAKRAEIDHLKGDELAKFRDAAETADRNYQLGAVPLTIYVETQKQYLELVGALAELQKDALQAAQELGILTGLQLYSEEKQR
jgi:cobalt-zinc-cadmium efflux system outer membrane protein